MHQEQDERSGRGVAMLAAVLGHALIISFLITMHQRVPMPGAADRISMIYLTPPVDWAA